MGREGIWGGGQDLTAEPSALPRRKNEDQVTKPFRSLDCGSLSLGPTYKMCFSIDSVSQKSVLLLDSSSCFFKKKKKKFIELVQI